MDITKAIVPAAGLGTRLLPYTKSTPKELLPIICEPAIQIIAREGVQSGIVNFSIITNKDKKALEAHFSPYEKLEKTLAERGNEDLLSDLENLITTCTFNFINQEHPLGLGHAIALAKNEIQDEFFAVFLPDDIIHNPNNPAIAQLKKVAQKHKACVIAVMEVEGPAISSYGVIDYTDDLGDGLYKISGVVEKPAAQDAPSNLAIIGRYIFCPEIFTYLEQIKPSSTGEIQLTDAIELMIADGYTVLGYKFEGTRFDLGTPGGWLAANTFMGLQDPAYAPEIEKAYALAHNQ